MSQREKRKNAEQDGDGPDKHRACAPHSKESDIVDKRLEELGEAIRLFKNTRKTSAADYKAWIHKVLKPRVSQFEWSVKYYQKGLNHTREIETAAAFGWSEKSVRAASLCSVNGQPVVHSVPPAFDVGLAADRGFVPESPSPVFVSEVSAWTSLQAAATSSVLSPMRDEKLDVDCDFSMYDL